MNKFMQIAVKEAFAGLRAEDGGPFGAVITLKQKVIAQGHNEVLRTNDPTAHAEIVAIRRACAKLQRFDLHDCVIYTSCEPCPMCFAAIHWAKFRKMYYGCTRQDAAQIGFDDQYIYDVIKGTADQQQVHLHQIDRDHCLSPFQEWAQKDDKTPY